MGIGVAHQLIPAGTSFIVPATAGGGAFDPSQLTGLAGWWDADDATTFTYSSGSVVSQWRDKSGNTRHMAPAAGSPNRNGTQNSKTTVVFDGASKINTPSWTHTKPVTVFVIARSTTASGQCDLLMFSPDGRVYRSGGGTIDLFGGGNITTGVQWGTTAHHRITAVFNNAASLIACDGGGDVVGNDGSTAFTTTYPFTVGGYNQPGGEWWIGDVAELCVYDRALTTPERTQVEGYLKTKWGTS